MKSQESRRKALALFGIGAVFGLGGASLGTASDAEALTIGMERRQDRRVNRRDRREDRRDARQVRREGRQMAREIRRE